MATEVSSSQREGYSNSEMVHEQRQVMSANLFLAAMKGDEDVLIPRLGLPKERNEVMVTIEASHSAPHQIKTEQRTVQSELQSATHFGDTILHLLVTKRHNELALKVFQRDMSLLKAQNKMLETPLHCAAKIGNEEVIENLILINAAVVRDALEETNENGDTVLHVAVRYGCRDISVKLMEFAPEMAYKVNNKMISSLYIVIDEEHNFIAEKMLQVDPTLACTPFSNGIFPVHLAARKNNWMMVQHFMENYPDYAELVDPRGRNLFHIAAEEKQTKIFWDAFENTSTSTVGEMIARMNNAMDYEGNTPFHIAAMKGHRAIMKKIWSNEMINHVAELRNKRGLTPYEVSKRQLQENTNENNRMGLRRRISDYEKINGEKFSKRWFQEIVKPLLPDVWERTQLIGLGSILITTVTFAAAFTIPGGYNQDDGTPVLGRKYMFWAFILANALSFIQGFLSLFALLINALPGMPTITLEFALIFFLLAASTMVVAFGLGLYVTLAPVCLPIAILLLVITLFIGSPAQLVVFIERERYIGMVTKLFANLRTIVATYIMSLLLIFCLALLYL